MRAGSEGLIRIPRVDTQDLDWTFWEGLEGLRRVVRRAASEVCYALPRQAGKGQGARAGQGKAGQGRAARAGWDVEDDRTCEDGT